MEDLAKRIIYKWEAGGKKPMLVGKPGCGKTAFVTYLANKIGAELIVLNLATFEASDMNGIPYLDPETHEMKWGDPFFVKQVIENDKKVKHKCYIGMNIKVINLIFMVEKTNLIIPYIHSI